MYLYIYVQAWVGYVRTYVLCESAEVPGSVVFTIMSIHTAMVHWMVTVYVHLSGLSKLHHLVCKPPPSQLS